MLLMLHVHVLSTDLASLLKIGRYLLILTFDLAKVKISVILSPGI